MVKKKINEAVILIGVLLVVVGLVVCMCERPDFHQQVRTSVSGLLIMVIGAFTCYLGNEGSEYYG